MAGPIMTRSQRRMEKKQALVLLALVLAVSLVSFTLGVMVGKSSREPVAVAPPPPERRPVIPPASLAAKPPTSSRAPESLTFYDTLPKGEQPPLGSGINLAPADKTLPPPTTLPRDPGRSASSSPAEVKPSAAAPPAPATKVPPTVTSIPAPAVKEPSSSAREPKAEVPAGAAKGTWIVQVASFKEAGDARKLQERLGGKGYSASVREVDLGAKGKWYRVVVGPYASEAAASKAAARLKKQEKASTVVRKG